MHIEEKKEEIEETKRRKRKAYGVRVSNLVALFGELSGEELVHHVRDLFRDVSSCRCCTFSPVSGRLFFRERTGMESEVKRNKKKGEEEKKVRRKLPGKRVLGVGGEWKKRNGEGEGFGEQYSKW